MTATPPDMWWPSPEAFDVLIVEDAEYGFDLSAPDDSECGEWLAYWSQDDIHQKVFEQEFIAVLKHYANEILDQHGETEDQPDEQTGNREQTENDSTGALT
jgi:hypothetical protein